MAHKESEKINDENYTLGGYTFEFSHRGTSVFVTCTDSEGKKATKGASVGDSEILGWYVEANETETTVYVSRKLNKNSPLIEGDLSPVSAGECGHYENPEDFKIEYNLKFNYAVNAAKYQNTVIAAMPYDSSAYSLISCGRNSYYWSDSKENWVPSGGKGTGSSPHYFSYGGKQVVYSTIGAYWADFNDAFNLLPSSDVQSKSSGGSIIDKIAWSLVYSTPGEEKPTDILVARFAIDLHKAGGGPEDSYDDPEDWEDWDDPEDYDPEEDPIEWGDPDYPDPEDPDYPDPIEWGDPDYPDPEDPDYPDPIYPDDPDYPDPEDPDYPGDQDGDGEPDPYHPDYHPDYYPPTKTLYLTVTGATSGTHESGITAAPNEIAADYGCGGNGGHGGGGGAGSSTVVIHKFATSKANSKEVTAISQPHGYGSGGGKGGKGGDGIILIYY